MKTFIPALAIVLVFCQMEFKREKNTDFSVVRIDTPKVKDEIFSVVEKKAEFEGGDKELVKFIITNFKYPNQAENCGSKVVVSFVIEKDGSVSKDNIKIMNVVCPELAQEAIRVFALSPRWKPAIHQGKPVKYYLRVPIQLEIDR